MSELNFAKTFLQTLDAKPTKYQADHVFDPKTCPTRRPFTLPKLPQPPHPPLPKKSATASTSTPAATAASAAAPGDAIKPTTTTAEPITLLLKSSRNPSLNLTIPSLNPATTTISQLKEWVQDELRRGDSSSSSTAAAAESIVSIPIEKIKILYNKRPIPASKKTVSDVLDDSSNPAELGIMIMGGAPDLPPRTIHPSTDDTAAAAAATSDDDIDAAKTVKQQQQQQQSHTAAPTQSPTSTGQDILRTPDFWTDLQGFLSQRIKDEAMARTMAEKWRDGMDVK